MSIIARHVTEDELDHKKGAPSADASTARSCRDRFTFTTPSRSRARSSDACCGAGSMTANCSPRASWRLKATSARTTWRRTRVAAAPERNASMYLEGGHAYVYFTYGMHWCLNVVTQEEDVAEAVLLRGAEPLSGIDAMRERRPKAQKPHELMTGPGKICMAMDIDRRLDGESLAAMRCGSPRDSQLKIGIEDIAVSPRIGIDNLEMPRRGRCASSSAAIATCRRTAMSDDHYRTLASRAELTLKIERSEFLGIAFRSRAKRSSSSSSSACRKSTSTRRTTAGRSVCSRTRARAARMQASRPAPPASRSSPRSTAPASTTSA
jgi:3-methyladenine DNA glycosylase Mpg